VKWKFVLVVPELGDTSPFVSEPLSGHETANTGATKTGVRASREIPRARVAAAPTRPRCRTRAVGNAGSSIVART
jgi:hypothetical protein